MELADPVGNLAKALQHGARMCISSRCAFCLGSLHAPGCTCSTQQLSLYAFTLPAARLSSLGSKCAPTCRGIRCSILPDCMQDRLKWSSPATFLLELVPAANNGSVTFKPSFEEVQQILDNAVEEAVKAVCSIPRQGNAETPAGSWLCCSKQADTFRSMACPCRANLLREAHVQRISKLLCN